MFVNWGLSVKLQRDGWNKEIDNDSIKQWEYVSLP